LVNYSITNVNSEFHNVNLKYGLIYEYCYKNIYPDEVTRYLNTGKSKQLNNVAVYFSKYNSKRNYIFVVIDERDASDINNVNKLYKYKIPYTIDVMIGIKQLFEQLLKRYKHNRKIFTFHTKTLEFYTILNSSKLDKLMKLLCVNDDKCKLYKNNYKCRKINKMFRNLSTTIKHRETRKRGRCKKTKSSSKINTNDTSKKPKMVLSINIKNENRKNYLNISSYFNQKHIHINMTSFDSMDGMVPTSILRTLKQVFLRWGKQVDYIIVVNNKRLLNLLKCKLRIITNNIWNLIQNYIKQINATIYHIYSDIGKSIII